MARACREEQERLATLTPDQRAAEEAERQRRRRILDEMVRTTEEMGLYDEEDLFPLDNGMSEQETP
jgi:hypothetical protein